MDVGARNEGERGIRKERVAMGKGWREQGKKKKRGEGGKGGK